MLILSSRDGVAAVAFGEEIKDGVKYRFRYRPNGGRKEQSGVAEVFEKYKRLPANAPGGGKVVADEGGKLFIKAGPIKMEWSLARNGRGWICYEPESIHVQIADAKSFDTINLQRFAQSTTPEEDAEIKEEHAQPTRPVQKTR